MQKSGYVAALVRSYMNGLKAFERTIEQTIETMPPKAQNNESCYTTEESYTAKKAQQI